jgi:carbon-monoxide dehydrogenase medium subunit
MLPFELDEPKSLHEAIDLLDPNDPTVRALAGGTGLMLMMKAGAFRPNRLVSLGRIETRYGEITEADNGELRIGAMTRLSMVEHDERVIRAYPVIKRTMRTLANVRVRNTARIGGTLSHADPNMDLPPLLAALGARVSIRGQHGSHRELPVENLYAGYYETTLKAGELICEVILPAPTSWRATYVKCTTRSADDWPALGLAIALDLNGDTVRDCRIVLGAGSEKLTRLVETEKILRNAIIDAALLRRASDVAVGEVSLTGDVRGSVPYKEELLKVYTSRGIRMSAEEKAAP